MKPRISSDVSPLRGAAPATVAQPAFRNRTEAGRLLAARLRHYASRPEVIVLGLARGDVPVAVEIARRLGVAVDVLVVRKLDVPCQPELAMGAIAPGGVCILNDDLIDSLDIEVDAIGAVRLLEEQELDRREQLYRGHRPPPEVRGKAVIVVDDGIATGATMHAALVFLQQQDAARIVLATPVMAGDTVHKLQPPAAEAVALIVADNLRSIGGWYADFSPVPDGEVQRLLGFSPREDDAESPQQFLRGVGQGPRSRPPKLE